MGCRTVATISGDDLMTLPNPSFYEGPSIVDRLHSVLSGPLRLGCQNCSDFKTVYSHITT